MYRKFFVSCFFLIFTLVTIGMSSVYADEDPYDIPAGAAVYADVHGNVVNPIVGDITSVHVHGIVYAKDDPLKNSDAAGNYSLILTVSEPEKEGRGLKKWGRENYQNDVYLQGSFQGELHEDKHVTFDIDPSIDIRNIGWTASATVQLKNSLGEPDDPVRDYDEKKLGEFGENEDWEDAQGDAGSAPSLGITLANSGQTFQPGDSLTLDIVTADPFYNISWYVHTPGDTSSSGTYQYDNYGDGTATSGSFYYTIPSGAMHTGDYLFRALVYRWSDMFYVGEETYTVSVTSE